MPGLTGLEVAALAAEASPKTQIVFVTAYDQYAIDAFERGAIDYLLKPVKPERLQATVERLQAVSYTHLDVYKRQVHRDVRAARDRRAW